MRPSALPTTSTLIVAIDRPASGAETVRLLRPDGSEARRFELKPGADAQRAAGSRIFVREGGGVLKAIHREGAVEDLGNLGDPDAFNLTVSPDGTRWMWGTIDASNWDNKRGLVYVAGDRLPARVVAQSTQDTTPHGGAVMPFSWTQVGAFLANGPVGVGGYAPFGFGVNRAYRLDPLSLAAAPLPHTDECSLGDVAADGTIACFPLDVHQQSHSLSLIAPDGRAKAIELAKPRFLDHGDVFFSPDGSQLTVAGATDVGADGKPEQFGTDVVATADASIERLAIDGVRLGPIGWASWLDDGSLVVYRPQGAAGGPSGIYVVKPGGGARQISAGGIPIGLLTG